MMKSKRALVIGLLIILALSVVGIVAAQESTPEATTQPTSAYLGISVSEAENGVTVGEVVPDGPAEAAGLLTGDIIIQFAGEAVNVETLLESLASFAPGDVVDVEVLRGEETLTVSVTLGERPADLDTPHGRLRDRFGGFNSDDEIAFFAEEGVIEIRALGEDSPLAEAGLQAGDRITAINGEAIQPGELRLVLPDLRNSETIALTVERDEETLEVEVPTETLLQLFVGGMRGNLPMMPGMPNMPGMPGDMNPPMDDFGRGQRDFEFRERDGRGLLGVAFVPLSEASAAENGVDVTEGALITQVATGSPAETAGLLVNDVVTAVNGEVVDAEHTLADRINDYESGDVVTLDVLRGGETLQIEVTLGQFEMRSATEPGTQSTVPVPEVPAQGASL